MPSKIRQIAPSFEVVADSVCVSFANYLSRLPSLLSHQVRQKIRVHGEVLRISVANILPSECHVVSVFVSRNCLLQSISFASERND